MPEPDINKGGRPTDFKEEYIDQALIVCADDGYTNAKLAKLFSVTARTISNWLKEIPEFKEAVQTGKDEFDCEKVKKALNKRAVGFRYTETTKEYDSENNLVSTKKVSKLVVPDTKACDMWLCNRNPNRWRKLKHVEHTLSEDTAAHVYAYLHKEKNGSDG